jgi:hypothetical protein
LFTKRAEAERNMMARNTFRAAAYDAEERLSHLDPGEVLT